jgi:hypothetical protein
MKGWHIFLHSLQQVTGNLSGAIKVSAVPYLIQFIAMGLIMGFGGNAFDPEAMAEAGGPDGGFFLKVGIVALVAVFTSLWIAVAWHRYVLLGEEAPGYVPTLKSDRMWAYFVRSLGILLVLLAASIVMVIPAGILVGLTANVNGPSIVGGLIPIVVMIPVFVVLYRVSGSLPGAALGNDVDFWAGWKATKGANLDILVLILVAFGFSIVLNLFGLVPVIGIAIQFLGGWLMIMIGASILTTIYGHYIEGRDLSGIAEQPNPFE